MTRLPLDFPPLLEMAGTAFTALNAAYHAVLAAHSIKGPVTTFQDHIQVETMATLLSDLTRPESQALWLRRLAGRLGVPVPAVGCPEWERLEHHHVVMYRLGRRPKCRMVAFLDDATVWKKTIRCPALPDPDSADADLRALALAIVAAGGGS